MPQKIKGKIKEEVLEIIKRGKEVSKEVRGKVKETVTAVLEETEVTGENIWRISEGAVKGAVEAAKESGSKLSEVAHSAATGTMEAISEAGDKTKAVIREATEGTVKGLEHALEVAKETTGEATEKVKVELEEAIKKIKEHFYETRTSIDLIKSIKERRSINYFEPDIEISEEKIRELISIANLAPSSFNLQPWRLIVVNDKERKKALRKCSFDQPKVEEASAVLIMIADPDAVEMNAEKAMQSWTELGYIKSDEQKEMYRGMMGQLYGEKDSLQRTVFAVKNTSLFAMNFMTAARGLGFETHPMDGFDDSCIKKEFGIPEDKIIPMLIAVGFLKKGIALLPRAYRREIKEFAGFNSYC